MDEIDDLSLMQKILNRIDSYIRQNASPLDKAFYLQKRGELDSKMLLSELRKYQNPDGGFAHGIEPDVQAKVSSPIATTVALQYLAHVEIIGVEVLEKAVKYLESSFDPETYSWRLIMPEFNDLPHAPWWKYNGIREVNNQINPTAEVVGYLNKYQHLLSNAFPLKELNSKIIERLLHISKGEVHDLLCYKRLYELNQNLFDEESREKLFSLIKSVVEIDSAKWSKYVPRPLDFVDSPNSPFFDLFERKLIKRNIDYLVDTIIEDHWEPTWNWGGASDDWEKAKRVWSGRITVQSKLKLDAFRGWDAD